MRQLASVVFGGKFGLASVEAVEVIDATDSAIVARLAGSEVTGRESATDHVTVHFSAKVGVIENENQGAMGF